jgi:hypothetical protein
MLAQQPTEISILERFLRDGERVSNTSLGLDHEDLHFCVEFVVVAVLATPELSVKEFSDKLELDHPVELQGGLRPFTHERSAVHHICRGGRLIFHAVANASRFNRFETVQYPRLASVGKKPRPLHAGQVVAGRRSSRGANVASFSMVGEE